MNNTFTLGKKVTTTLFGLLFATAMLATNGNTIYVDLDATTGSNDGTSWSDAYNDLQEALDAAQPGAQLWVAEGIYLPGTDSLSSFVVATDVQLLGGFNGTEFSADQRDPAQYLTILSGDLMQNDLIANFDTLRTDNAQTVLILELNLTPNAVVDGFVIVGGHADGDDSEYHHRRGGGIFSYGRATVSGCVLWNNYADAGGGGMYYQGVGASGSTLQLCQFEQNEAEDGGGVMVGFLQEEGLEINACTFSNNWARSDGGAVKSYNSFLTLEGNTFYQNTSERNGGGVEIQYQGFYQAAVITDCVFEENVASRGGGLRYDASFALGVSFNSLEVHSSDFILNGAIQVDTAYGGGFLGGAVSINMGATTSFSNVEITGSNFTENYSDGRGGAMSFDLGGNDNNITLEGLYWGFNSASDFSCVDINTNAIASGTFTMMQSGFFDNQSSGHTGGLSIRSSQTAHVDFQFNDVVFSENTGNLYAGALSLTTSELGSINLVAEGCAFFDNGATGPGGAIVLSGVNDGLNTHFLSCLFSGNASPEGALLAGFPVDPGMGVPTGTNVRLDNCLIYDHQVGDALIRLDSFPTLEVYNSTFASNGTTLLALSNESSLLLQNTILETPTGNPVFADLTDDCLVVSTGGNIVGDDSMDDWMEGLDKTSTDPLFDTMGLLPFELLAGSPAIDAGVEPTDPPQLDIYGNARIQGSGIDAGAIESGFTSSLDEPFSPSFSANLFPNPAFVQTSVVLKTQTPGNYTINVYSIDGKLIQSRVVAQTEGTRVYPLPVYEWAAGTYQVEIKGMAYQQTIMLVVQ